MEAAGAVVKYVAKVEVAVTVACVVKLFYEFCEADDEVPSESQVLPIGGLEEIAGQFFFEGIGGGDFFGDDEASFFEE